MFIKTEFISSASKADQFPEILGIHGKPLPEIAFVGRSNVGKSSLINHLTRKSKLARISSTPGKTQLINFFEVDQQFCLVDLPGYGFAKVSKGKRRDWGKLIDDYLQTRKSLKLILHLCDARHPPSADDIAFAQWATHFGHPLVTIFTKTDKLSPHRVKAQVEKNFALLLDQIDGSLEYLPYSIKDKAGRTQLIKILERIL